MTKEHFEEDINLIFGVADDSPSMGFKNDQDKLIIAPKDENFVLKDGARILTKNRNINLDKIVLTNNANVIIIKNIKFENTVLFKTKNSKNKKLVFQECDFVEGLQLSENSFINFEFLQCDFKYKELFPFSKNLDLYFNVKFYNCVFDSTSANNLRFNTFEINNCKFFNTFDINIKECNIKKLIIGNSIFKKFCINSTDICEIEFKNSIFYEIFIEKLIFSEKIVNKKIEFKNCDFKEKVSLNDTNANKIIFNNSLSDKKIFSLISDFSNLTDIEEIDFSNSKFDTELKFDEFNFANINKNIKIDFYNCEFNKPIYGFENQEIKNKFGFYDSTFNDRVDLSNTVFKNKIEFFCCEFKSKVDLSNSTFKEKITFSDNDAIENESLKRLRDEHGKINTTIFKKQIKAQDTKFNKDVIFKNAIFEDMVDFKNSKFEGASEDFHILDFSNSKFYGDTYFNNSYFKNYADFHECEFAKVGNFFNTTSENCINFSSSIFKDFNKVNFINFNSSKIDLKNIEKCNKNLCNKSNLDKKILMANSLRDSFRVIKHSLSSVNNFLEASKFHKLELYAKEIELDYRINKGFKVLFNSRDDIYIKKEIKNKYNPENYKNINYKNILCLAIFVIAISIAIFYFKDFKDFIISTPCLPICLITILAMIYIAVILPFLIKFCKILLMLFVIPIKFFSLFVISGCRSHSLNNFFTYPTYHIKKYKYFRFIRYKTRKMLNFTTFIDYLILCIYRQTSDHHTNFTKIFNFTIMMIAIYGFMNFIMDKRLDHEIPQWWFIALFISLFILCITLILLLFKEYKFIPIFLFFIISIFLLIFFHFIFFKNEIGIEALSFVFLYLFFIISSIYIFSITNNLVVLMSRLISYIAFLTMLVLMPISIIPFANLSQLDNQKFLKEYLKNDLTTRNSKDDIIEILTIKETFLKNGELLKDADKVTKDNNETLKSIVEAINKDYKRDKISKSTNFVYIFILALCLYSLQKTGRRNSIVSV